MGGQVRVVAPLANSGPPRLEPFASYPACAHARRRSLRHDPHLPVAAALLMRASAIPRATRPLGHGKWPPDSRSHRASPVAMSRGPTARMRRLRRARAASDRRTHGRVGVRLERVRAARVRRSDTTRRALSAGNHRSLAPNEPPRRRHARSISYAVRASASHATTASITVRTSPSPSSQCSGIVTSSCQSRSATGSGAVA